MTSRAKRAVSCLLSFVLLGLSFPLLGSARAQETEPPKRKSADFVKFIQAQRTTALSWARKAKSKFAADSEQAKSAQAKYDEAKSQFASITEQVATAISNGDHVENLDLQEESDKAQEANKAFAEYVKEQLKTADETGFLSFLPIAIKVGAELLGITRETLQKVREQKAAQFRQKTKWPEWSAIS